MKDFALVLVMFFSRLAFLVLMAGPLLGSADELPKSLTLPSGQRMNINPGAPVFQDAPSVKDWFRFICFAKQKDEVQSLTSDQTSFEILRGFLTFSQSAKVDESLLTLM